ncbi:MAG: hypothetical protein AAGD07_22815 [Planctomycetota bacterium]
MSEVSPIPETSFSDGESAIDATADCPYRLFDYYRYQDRDIFFGRDEEVAQMVGDILSARLLVLFAPSGSGKSSLLHAGVRPELERRGFKTVFSRVGDDPEQSIVKELCRLDDASDPDATDIRAALKDRTAPVVVFIDQFEELFLQFEKESPERVSFPSNLADVLLDQSLRVYFVLSLRADYFVALNEFRHEIPAIFHNNANLELRPFDLDSARQAIVGPSTREGSLFSWQDGLPQQVIEDLKQLHDNHRVLPITLQIVCHTLWSNLPQGHGEISESDYSAAGGAEAIVHQRIFRSLEATPSYERRALCLTLRGLITTKQTKRLRAQTHLQKEVGSWHAPKLQRILERLQRDLLIERDVPLPDVDVDDVVANDSE